MKDSVIIAKCMLEACEQIGIFAGTDFDLYIKDKKGQLAIERCLEIIGQGKKDLDAAAVPDFLSMNFPTVDWKGLAGIRDKIAKAYHRTDQQLIWSTIEKDIPLAKVALEEAVALLLRAYPQT